MSKHTFRFLDDGLHCELVRRFVAAGVDHSIDEDGVIRYSAGDREVIEDDLIGSVRDAAFPAWQVLTCPGDWIACYREYMVRHDVPFVEELSDGKLWFLLPRTYRPHAWKLEGPIKEGHLVKSR